jgi:hypothetical protein
VGGVVSTVKVVLAELAVLELPMASLAVAAFIVIPTVPLPVQLERVTVGVAVVPSLTAFVQLAPPAAFRVMPSVVKL